MGWGSVASAVGGSAVQSLVERDWAKRDTVTGHDFEREQVARQEQFQITSATTAHLRNQENAKIAHERNLTADHFKHKRNMEGMRAAGLNPILAYQQGAKGLPGASSPTSAAPGGAKGSSQGTKPTKLDMVAAAQQGAQARLTIQNTEVAKANIRVLDSTAELNSAKAVQVGRQTAKTEVDIVGQTTENEIRALKKLQRETTGDSSLGRWITTVLRTGKMGYAEFRKLMKATHKMGRRHRAAALKFLDKHGFHVERRNKSNERFNYGKARNKKTIRRKYTRRHAGPR